MDPRPIGLFDSGIGGLTILRAVRRLLPRERLVFLADSAHFPYGAIEAAELCARTTRIANFLLAADAKLIVVACNTATVHALAHLRAMFPQVPFVGVVPVVKVLATRTRTGTIALLSTPGTAQSAYLAGLIATFAPSQRVVNVACEGLADLVERGHSAGPEAAEMLQRYLAPVLESGADVLGLGCTHYPFLRHQIRRLLGPGVRVYDSAEPVARRVQALLAERDALAGDPAQPGCEFYTTGEPQQLYRATRRFLRLPAHEVSRADLDGAGHAVNVASECGLPATMVSA